MFQAFDTALKTLDGFFARTFWFGTFLPVLVFAVVHSLLARSILFDANLNWLEGNWKTVDAIAVLVIVAFALAPVMPVMRGVLDGSFLWNRCHDWLRERRLPQMRKEQSRLSLALDEVGELRRLRQEDTLKLQEAYANASRLPDAADEALVANAHTAVMQCADRLKDGREPARSELADACEKLLQALAANNPELSQDRKDAGTSERLRTAANRFTNVLKLADAEAQYRYTLLYARQRSGTGGHVEATRLGDARYGIERYARKNYDVEFDYLWPRLLLVIDDKDPVKLTITSASSALDFSVLCTWLSVTVPLFWVPTLAAFGHNPALFLSVGTFGPLAVLFFYNLAYEAQLAFSQAAKTAIDCRRIEVLKLLRQVLPMTRSAERELWDRIRRTEEDPRFADLVYASEIKT